MIRFSAFLVAVAVGLLVAGVVTSKLPLVYIAIGVSGVALLVLGVGALLKRRELFGEPEKAELAWPEPAGVRIMAQPEPQVAPWEAPVPAGSGPAASAWPAAAQAGPSKAGYLPADQPVGTPVPAAPPPAARPASAVPLSAAAASAAGRGPSEATAAASGAAAAWGSGSPAPGLPDSRPADVQRPPAAFTPRPAAGAPSPAPSVWERPASVPPETLAAADRLPDTDQPARIQPSAEPDRPAEPEQPAGPQQSAGPEQPAEPDQPAGPEQSAEPEQPAGPDQPAEPEQSAGPQQSAEPERSAEPEQAAAAGPAPASPRAPDPLPGPADLQREVTVVPGVPRYHKAQCLLIRFMGENDLDTMTLGAAREAGCTPCRACLPDQPETDPELSRRGSSP